MYGRNKYSCEKYRRRDNNLQGKNLELVISFIRKEIIGKEEKYLVERGDSFLQGKYCTV